MRWLRRLQCICRFDAPAPVIRRCLFSLRWFNYKAIIPPICNKVYRTRSSGATVRLFCTSGFWPRHAHVRCAHPSFERLTEYQTDRVKKVIHMLILEYSGLQPQPEGPAEPLGECRKC
jgi:hypothetical protein